MKKSIGAKTILYPTPVLIVCTYDKDGKPNAMTAAWGGICCSKPPCVTVSLRKATYSYGNMMETKAYTLNIPSESYAKEADYFGMVSGKTVDKFAATGLTPVKSELVHAPCIQEFPFVVECKLLHTLEIGLHTQFVGEILDIKAYPSVLDVSESIDLAVVVIPYKYVPGAIKQCGEKGIPAAVIITAGFREAGHEGLEREHEVVALAKEYNMRIIGPNCLGVIDTFTPLNASFSDGTPPKGPMNFTSQSGALGTAILDWARAGRLGFAKFVSLGNKADVSEIDLFEAWADDPDANVLMAYIEGVSDGAKFIETSRNTSKKKPIISPAVPK